MAFNVRPGGKSESVPVVDTAVSGDLIRCAHLIGVAEINAEEGRDGVFYTTLALEGVANLPITGAVTVGQVVYTTTAHTAGQPGVVATLTTTAGAGALPVGIATRAKGTGAGTVWLKLTPNTTAPAA